MPIPIMGSGQITEKPDNWLIGQVSFTEECIIRTGYSESPIKFGYGVEPTSAEGYIEQASSVTNLLGIAVRALSYELDAAGNTNQYPAKYLVPYIVQGPIAVPLAGAVKQHDPVFLVTVGSGKVGQFFNAASGTGITTAVLIPNARFLRSKSSGNCPISVNFA